MLINSRIVDAIQAVLRATNTPTFDAVIPAEIGGLNAFETLLAAHRLDKAVLDTDCVGRAYPWVWQTVRCLQDIPIVPAAVAKGDGQVKVGIPRLNSVTDLLFGRFI